MKLMNRLRNAFTALLLAGALLVPVAAAGPVYANDVDGSRAAACAGIELSGAECNSGAEDRINKLIKTIVTFISYIVGVAAVIMIIVSGAKYITSGGDANKISSAKTTLIYAIVGLIIVVLAQFIVRFVINTAK